MRGLTARLRSMLWERAFGPAVLHCPRFCGLIQLGLYSARRAALQCARKASGQYSALQALRAGPTRGERRAQQGDRRGLPCERRSSWYRRVPSDQSSSTSFQALQAQRAGSIRCMRRGALRCGRTVTGQRRAASVWAVRAHGARCVPGNVGVGAREAASGDEGDDSCPHVRLLSNLERTVHWSQNLTLPRAMSVLEQDPN
jgi:hypothetical protein